MNALYEEEEIKRLAGEVEELIAYNARLKADGREWFDRSVEIARENTELQKTIIDKDREIERLREGLKNIQSIHPNGSDTYTWANEALKEAT